MNSPSRSGNGGGWSGRRLEGWSNGKLERKKAEGGSEIRGGRPRGAEMGRYVHRQA